MSIAPGLSDVAFFLATNVDPAVRREHEHALLRALLLRLPLRRGVGMVAMPVRAGLATGALDQRSASRGSSSVGVVE